MVNGMDEPEAVIALPLTLRPWCEDDVSALVEAHRGAPAEAPTAAARRA